MSARYGSRTRSGEAVSGFGQRGVGGAGFTKITISATPSPSATVSTYAGYISFKFTSSGTLNVTGDNVGYADVLLVGGGTGNNTPSPASGQPGWAGGAVKTSEVFIGRNTPVPVVVGGIATNSTFGPLTSSGGTVAPGGATGSPGAPGTAGTTNDYETGSSQTYGGGGGGGAVSPSALPTPGPTKPGGTGGAGGGGNGASVSSLPLPYAPATFIWAANVDATNGGVNTGGGAGGGSRVTPPPYSSGGQGAQGGSGVVVLRFPDSLYTT